MKKTILVDAYNTFVIEDQGVDGDLFNLLEGFENQKIIVTNANQQQREQLGLVDLPYDLFSMEHHPEKTNPLYFETLLKEYDLKATDAIYFEHDSEAVIAASSIGIHSYRFDHTKRNLAALKDFLDYHC